MSTKTKWYGLTMVKKLPKDFTGIVLEDSHGKEEHLLVSKYVNGILEGSFFKVEFSDIIDNLYSLEDIDPNGSEFLRRFLVLFSNRKLRRSSEIFITAEVQEIISENLHAALLDYIEDVPPSDYQDTFPDDFHEDFIEDVPPSDTFSDDFPDDFPEDLLDYFPDDFKER